MLEAYQGGTTAKLAEATAELREATAPGSRHPRPPVPSLAMGAHRSGSLRFAFRPCSPAPSRQAQG